MCRKGVSGQICRTAPSTIPVLVRGATRCDPCCHRCVSNPRANVVLLNVTLLSRFASPGRGWLYSGLRINQSRWYSCFIGLVRWCSRIGRASPYPAMVQVRLIQRCPRLHASVCLLTHVPLPQGFLMVQSICFQLS